MQPAYIPNSQDIVAVLRAAEYSNLYLLSSQGSIIRQLSNNANAQSTQVYLNHWMFYPHMGADGNTIYFSYDQPKNSSTLAVDFSVWSGTLTGKLAGKQLTNSNLFTGGDVDPTPMANGSIIYSKFAIGNGNAFSQIAIQVKPLGRTDRPDHARAGLRTAGAVTGRHQGRDDLHRRHRPAEHAARGRDLEQREAGNHRKRWSTTACAPTRYGRRMAAGSSTTTPPMPPGTSSCGGSRERRARRRRHRCW